MICYAIILFTSCLFSGEEIKNGKDLTVDVKKIQEEVWDYLKPSEDDLDMKKLEIEGVKSEIERFLGLYFQNNQQKKDLWKNFDWQQKRGFFSLKDPREINVNQSFSKKNSFSIKRDTINAYELSILIYSQYFTLNFEKQKEDRLALQEGLKVDVCKILQLGGVSEDKERNEVKEDVEKFIDFLSFHRYKLIFFGLYTWTCKKEIFRKHIKYDGIRKDILHNNTGAQIQDPSAIAEWIFLTTCSEEEERDNTSQTTSSEENKPEEKEEIVSNQSTDDKNNTDKGKNKTRKHKHGRKLKRSGNSSFVYSLFKYASIITLMGAVPYSIYFFQDKKYFSFSFYQPFLRGLHNNLLFLKQKISQLTNTTLQVIKEKEDRPKKEESNVEKERFFEKVLIETSLFPNGVPLSLSEPKNNKDSDTIHVKPTSKIKKLGVTFSLLVLPFLFAILKKDLPKKMVEKYQKTDEKIRKILRICASGIAVAAAAFILFYQ